MILWEFEPKVICVNSKDALWANLSPKSK